MMNNNIENKEILELDYIKAENNNDGLVDVEAPQGFSVDVEADADFIPEASVVEEKKPAKKHIGQKGKTIVSNTLIYVLLVVMSIIWLVPFVCIVLESFRVENSHMVGYIIPMKWGFDNYVRLFKETNFPTWFGNTFIIGLVVAVVQTIFVLSMSYVLSRFRFKMRKPLMNIMLVLGMFPGFLTLILLYKLLSGWGMTNENSVYGLILVYVASSGMGYYVSKGFFDTISKSLDEAARIDGATRFQVFYKIIMPLAKPIVIYTILTAFMAPWGDFVMAKYLANNNQDGMNVAVGLQWLISTPQNKDAYYTVFCAGGVVVAIPITLLFMFLQKYYVEGVTGGAVKG